MWLTMLTIWNVGSDALATSPARIPPARPIFRPRPPGPVRPPPRYACEPAELRVSSIADGWYDLYLDGELRIQARMDRGQSTISVPAGPRHLRVTSHTGQPYASETLAIDCGEVLVVDVGESGIEILNRWGGPPPAGPVVGPPPGACSSGSMTFLPASGSPFFDVFIDGEKRLESRVDSNARLALHPGRYQVTIAGIGGDVWSTTYVDLGCGESWTGQVEQSRGLR